MGSKVNNVVVLMPNGRRESLKVNLDSSVLQILEDVCKKHGFSSKDFALKHQRNVLDPASVIRFCSLPNNAFLEVVPSTRQSQDSIVILSLQVDGEDERIMGEFLSDSSLEDVLLRLVPKFVEHSDKRVPVVVYMRREIVGLDALKITTLRTLGLTSGRALLRLTTRDKEEHPDLQCTGGLVLSRSLSEKRDKSPSRSSSRDEPVKRTTDESVPSCQKRTSKPIPAAEIITAAQVVSSVIHRASESKVTKGSTSNSPQGKSKEISFSKNKSADRSKSPSPMEVVKEKEKIFNLEDVKYLDQRNGLVFQMQDSNCSFSAELPDSFFDVTIDDVRLLMRDLKRNRESMEQAPLQTEQLRKIEIENKIKLYDKTVLRIQFPDRLILQGVFEPSDTVADVYNFVKSYIIDPDSDFYLYTAPPKRILPLEDTLFAVGCVPCAKIYFSYSNQSSEGSTTAQRSLHDKVNPFMTTQAIATFAATKLRGLKDKSVMKCQKIKFDVAVNDGASGSRMDTCSKDSKVHSEKTDEENDNDVTPPSRQSSTSSAQGKVPKWFKPL
ncbi:tether containing UBX domain for GLUT4 [Lycorma delicatula]|uniref:tether containing UBX domain for GLUT4 n=1 Tax=Lycorma delicatula TaxID=130591 RepID=UPI003F51A5BF